MDPKPSLKLYGNWASHFSQRVQLALKLKGLEYEYVEEDLSKKSPDLLCHNPIYKKVPVLIHNGHAIPESIVILHYIDETWPEQYPLLPADILGRATVRFWCHFLADRLAPAGAAVFMAGEDADERRRAALEGFREDASILEKNSGKGISRTGGSSAVTGLGSWTSCLGVALWDSYSSTSSPGRRFFLGRRSRGSAPI